MGPISLSMCPRLGTRLSARQTHLSWAQGPVTNYRAEDTGLYSHPVLLFLLCRTQFPIFVSLCFCFLSLTLRSSFVKSVATYLLQFQLNFVLFQWRGLSVSITVPEVETESTFYQLYWYLSLSLGRQWSLFCFLILELYFLGQLSHTAKLSRKWDRYILSPDPTHAQTGPPPPFPPQWYICYNMGTYTNTWLLLNVPSSRQGSFVMVYRLWILTNA